VMDPEEWNEFVKETSKIAKTEDSSRVMTLFQELTTLQGQFMDAKAAKDWPTMSDRLSKLEELYAKDKVAAFIIGPELPNLRAVYTWQNDWDQAVLQWETSVNTGEFDAADRHMQTFERLIDEMKNGQISSSFSPEMKQRQELYFDFYKWTQMCYAAAHRCEGNPQAAIAVFDDVINRPGTFFEQIQAIESTSVNRTLQIAIVYRLKCLIACKL
jgi:hypothetical protein